MVSTLRHTAKQLISQQKKSTAALICRQQSTSTEKNVLSSPYKPIPKSNFTVTDFVWQNLDKWPDKTATVCALTGHGYTYHQTYKMSVAFAASLRKKLKLKNDDHVAISLPNIPEYPCTVLGVMLSGCIASLMNPAYTARELQHQLKLIDCKAVVTSKLSYPNIVAALKTLNMKIPIIVVENEVPGGAIKFAEFAEDFTLDADCLKSVTRSPDDTAILPFSSGTTGFPKGVVLTHKSVVAMNQMIIDPIIIAVKETTSTFQTVSPAILPFFHIFGFNALMLAHLYMGCKLVTMPYFKPDIFTQTLVNHRPDVLYIVPPMVVFLGKSPSITSDHLQSIDSVISGAAPVSQGDAAALIAKNNKIVFRQGYGLTETNGGVSVAKNTDTNCGSVGHVFPSCEVKIADLNTQEALGPNEEGELWFRGPCMMEGYYKNEAATRDTMAEDGWYKTGDIGKYDDNQYLYVTDRLKELIKVKGYQVPPAELEALIRTHPKILDCAVLGIPDDIAGEVPKAFVVVQPGQKASTEEIKEFVNKNVASFKRLHEVQVVEAIPKTASGKILRKELKNKYC